MKAWQLACLRIAPARHFAEGAGLAFVVGRARHGLAVLEAPLAYEASYAASKAGVLALGRALNEELRLARLSGVHVATVMPWAADTPFFVHAGNYTGRQPNMVALDPPEKVVEAIVWVSVNPREELPVGWQPCAPTRPFSCELLSPQISTTAVSRPYRFA